MNQDSGGRDQKHSRMTRDVEGFLNDYVEGLSDKDETVTGLVEYMVDRGLTLPKNDRGGAARDLVQEIAKANKESIRVEFWPPNQGRGQVTVADNNSTFSKILYYDHPEDEERLAAELHAAVNGGRRMVRDYRRGPGSGKV